MHLPYIDVSHHSVKGIHVLGKFANIGQANTHGERLFPGQFNFPTCINKDSNPWK